MILSLQFPEQRIPNFESQIANVSGVSIGKVIIYFVYVVSIRDVNQVNHGSSTIRFAALCAWSAHMC